jgi:hypothetical protein
VKGERVTAATTKCTCGWPLPKGLQLLTGGMDRVLLACGQCGSWWLVELSPRGGWSREESEKGASPATNLGASATELISGPQPGTWNVSSKKDPRWNGYGRTQAMLFSAGPPPEVKDHIERRTRELGEPPDDLSWGGMKD